MLTGGRQTGRASRSNVWGCRRGGTWPAKCSYRQPHPYHTSLSPPLPHRPTSPSRPVCPSRNVMLLPSQWTELLYSLCTVEVRNSNTVYVLLSFSILTSYNFFSGIFFFVTQKLYLIFPLSLIFSSTFLFTSDLFNVFTLISLPVSFSHSLLSSCSLSFSSPTPTSSYCLPPLPDPSQSPLGLWGRSRITACLTCFTFIFHSRM